MNVAKSVLFLVSLLRLNRADTSILQAARILTSFINPKQAFGPDKVIPPSILSNAKVSSTLPNAYYTNVWVD